MSDLSDLTHYDDIAEQYNQYVDNKPFNAYYERPFMCSQLPSLPGTRILDVGCGSGFYSAHAASRGAEVIATDASPKMVKHTERRVGSGIEAHVADLAEPMPFVADNSVDIIICSLVLHYVRDWSVPLREFHRVLRPGGLCLISTHHPLIDWTGFGERNYFETELISDTWSGFGEQPMAVKHFLRPLSSTLNALISSPLDLESVSEPAPSPDLESLDAALFKRLSTQPAFLFFRMSRSC